MKGAFIEDKFFSERNERRVYMPSESFLSLIDRLDLKEDEDSKTTIQNVYFDSNDMALPLGTAARLRRYIKEPEQNFVFGGEQIIDIGYTHFEKKVKYRFKGTSEELNKILNVLFPIHNHDYRPFVAVQYERQIFSKKNLRVTFDQNISLFTVGADGEIKEIGHLGRAIIEVKYINKEGYKTFLEMASGEHSELGPSKHYLPYNALYFNKRPRNLFKQLGYIKELNGEIEMKFDTTNPEVYIQFLTSLYNDKKEGYNILKAHPEPLTLESINEYKSMPNGTIARLMHVGVENPYYIAKDKGIFNNDILVRREDKVEGERANKEIPNINTLPSIGTTQRIKRLDYIESKSGMIYNTSIDLSQMEGNRELMQIEIEYLRSEKVHEDPPRIVLEEIQELGNHLKLIGGDKVRKSNLRKEDWIKSIKMMND